jgi:hypothetical protein
MKFVCFFTLFRCRLFIPPKCPKTSIFEHLRVFDPLSSLSESVAFSGALIRSGFSLFFPGVSAAKTKGKTGSFPFRIRPLFLRQIPHKKRLYGPFVTTVACL